MDWTPATIAVLYVLGLFLVAFGQSGVDKIVDRAGNLEWLIGHFASSPFRNMVRLLLSIITIMELASAALCGIAIVGMIAGQGVDFAKWALAACGATLLCLFAGQRFAKDYAGAMTLAVYSGVLAVGLVALELCHT
jgi:hypothetical protein